MSRIIPLRLVSIGLTVLLSCSSLTQREHDDIAVKHQERNAQIELGNMFVGIEMHNSKPLLNRISFYYPRANSIDLSRDYWKREKWRIQKLAMKSGDEPVQWLDDISWDIKQIPFTVTFHSMINDIDIHIKYQFCDSVPAWVATYTLENHSGEERELSFFTELSLILKTCHAYTTKMPDHIRYREDPASVIAEFESEETGRARVFIQNGGEPPVSYQTCRTDSSRMADLEQTMASGRLEELPYDSATCPDPAGAFLYRKRLSPGNRMQIIQITGATGQDRLEELMNDLRENHIVHVNRFEDRFRKMVDSDLPIKLHDEYVDHAAGWARCVLETNRHWLDGDVLYMPCPAQYNFFFTHDMLYADLTTVHFMPERVKHDLGYLVRHADQEMRIPHARYWREDGYKTEFADTDNWNNMWMVITSASYLRHTGDMEFMTTLYPYLEKCIERGLVNLKGDSLIWSASPDWWDIGNNFGPRAYRTILAVKMIDDFIYVSGALGKNLEHLPGYERLAGNLKKGLNSGLWDPEKNYYMNFLENNEADPHYYAGSLVAAHFDLSTGEYRSRLIGTAEKFLLDPLVGVRNVFPMDIHDWKDKLRYSGNEAGAPGYYFNGGIWAHNNSWYVLALLKDGRYQDAFGFIRNSMTVKGIMDGPNGQPAMYEVRNALQNNQEVYGSVDKPQFLWAASWYLYDLFRLTGIRETTWNLSMDYRAPLITEQYEAQFYAHGAKVSLSRRDHSATFPLVKTGKERLPSGVVPVNLNGERPCIEYVREIHSPVLLECASILKSVTWNENENELQIEVKAFPGHLDSLTVCSKHIPEMFLVDENPIPDWKKIKCTENGQIYVFHFRHHETAHRIRIVFSE